MALALCVSGGIAGAQTLLEYVCDQPADARSIALGEAFVAIASGPAGMFYNVAGLASERGSEIQFNTRDGFSPTYESRSLSHSEFAATLGTGMWGGFGVRFKSYTSVDSFTVNPVSGASGPLQRYLDSASTHTIDVAAAYATDLSPTMSVGAGIGMVRREYHWTTQPDFDPRQGAVGVTGNAFYITAGFRYHESLLKSNVPDEFSFAASLEHYGTPLDHDHVDPPAIDLARTIRAGVAWRIAQPETTALSTEFLSALISGQFKKVLNEGDFTADGFTSNKGYWSLGLELGIWNMFFVRYGLEYRPFTSPYSFQNNGQTNVGAGAHLPLHKVVGGTTPVWLDVDYAYMILLDRQHLSAVSVGIHLDHDLFPVPRPAPPPPPEQ